MLAGLLLLAGLGTPVAGAPLLNEILASNRTGLLDGFGQNEDWVELHNPGPGSVNLAGYYLTDEPDFPTKWAFPSIVMAANTYRVLIASGRDLTDSKGYVHLGFNLDRNGDFLALVAPDGTTVVDHFSPSYPEQFTDVSYGRQTSDGALRFFGSPSPGSANGSGYLGVVQDTTFSMDRGFYDAPFLVEVSSATPGAAIRYTTDGSKPSETYGSLYTGPLTISTTTPLRAIAYRVGWLPTDVDAQTYLFVDDVIRQPEDPPGWPTDWGSEGSVALVPSDYEMDPRVVDHTLPGYSVPEALLDIPSVSVTMRPEDFLTNHDANGIYANPLSRWEREASVEYIHPDGQPGFQLNCKIEVHGNSSRNPYRMQKHSLRLTFTSEYGPPRLNHPLFPDSPVDRFNQLVLRACFTDSWGLVSWSSTRYRPNDSQYLRDVWMKESLGAMGQPTSHGNYVHLYVNGLYFGLHNLTERLAPDFFADHLGGEPEDWEINEDLSSAGTRWNTMMGIDPSTLAGYQQIENYLDTTNFADYMLLHFYADAEDWPHHNGYAAANPTSGDGRFRFFSWDQEIVLDYHGRAGARIDNTKGAGALFQKMRTSKEFRLFFADRTYEQCFNDGALSLAASQARYLDLAGAIDKAIVAESARWGDAQKSTAYGNNIDQPSPLDSINHNAYPPAPNGPDYFFTREDSWVVERDNVVSNYLPAVHNTDYSYAFLNLFRSKGLYPAIDPPVFNQHGGQVEAHFGLLMSAPSGAIYYTLDGSDPRLPGGAVQPGALVHDGSPVVFETSPVRVRARVRSGTTWSAMHDAVFYVDTERARAGNVIVSEVHYNPKGSDDYEFIELLNVGPVKVALKRVRLAGAVDFTFGEQVLDVGGRIVVVEDVDAFSNRYLRVSSPYAYAPIEVAGSWKGGLDNGGDELRLLDKHDREIQAVSYNDNTAYPGRADGRGASLVCHRPEVAPVYPEYWRASSLFHGSPGRADPGPDVVINELLSHSNTGTDWVELLSISTQAVTVGTWYLSDSLDDWQKFPLPAATFAPGAFWVLDESDFNQGAAAFSFSELGEEVVLTEASGTNLLRVIGFEDFGAAEQDVVFGRHFRQDGSDRFSALRSATRGSANDRAKVGPVLIGEIMYHPQSGLPEYVELLNTGAEDIPLFDPDHPTNTWSLTSGVSFSFPPGVSIPTCGRMLVSETDPASLRAAYSISPGIPIYGPWSGSLDNKGESVRLRKPGSPELDGTVPSILVDKIDFRDYAPWPPAADGQGASLERLDYAAYGDDAANWYGAETSTGTPGGGPDPCNYTPNRPPVLSSPGLLTGDEGTLIAAVFQAVDPDVGQQVTLGLEGAVPEGLLLTTDGDLSWTPGEEYGPGTVSVVVTATDNGIPNLQDRLVVPITVHEINSPPDILRGSTGMVTNVLSLVSRGAVWHFLDTGVNAGGAWRASTYNHLNWSSGPAPLGYGDSHIATTVGYGPNSSSKYVTTYFRHAFTVEDPSTLTNLTAYLMRDDAAILYLNEQELVRNNMPTGPVNYLTFSTNGVSAPDETALYEYELDPVHLVPGTNVVAVEVHQASFGSSDLGFDLALEAVQVARVSNGLQDLRTRPGERAQFVVQTADSDLPVQHITYSLAPGAPAGAAVDPLTGVFQWTPTADDRPGVHALSMSAVDDGSPPSGDEEAFTVTVIGPLDSGDIVVRAGTVAWTAIPGDHYRVEYSDQLAQPSWTLLEERLAVHAWEQVVDPGFAGSGARCYRIIWSHNE